MEDKVLEVLKNSNKPLKGTEIAELAQMEKKDVDKAIKKLKDSDKITSPIRCFYAAK